MVILGMRPTVNKLHHLLATGQEVKLTRISFWMADKLNWWYQVAGPSQWHHPSSLWLLLVKVFLSYYVLLCHLPPLLHLQQCRCASYYFFEVISKHQHLLLLLASSSTLAYNNRLILDEHILLNVFYSGLEYLLYDVVVQGWGARRTRSTYVSPFISSRRWVVCTLGVTTHGISHLAVERFSRLCILVLKSPVGYISRFIEVMPCWLGSWIKFKSKKKKSLVMI